MVLIVLLLDKRFLSTTNARYTRWIPIGDLITTIFFQPCRGLGPESARLALRMQVIIRTHQGEVERGIGEDGGRCHNFLGSPLT